MSGLIWIQAAWLVIVFLIDVFEKKKIILKKSKQITQHAIGLTHYIKWLENFKTKLYTMYWRKHAY